MRHNIFEILLGAIILALAIFIAGYAFIYNSNKVGTHYLIDAEFGRIDGIIVGADVKLGGVKIGRVAQTSLDKISFASKVSMEIDAVIKLPKQTEASIASEGLLGKNFIRLKIPQKLQLPISYLEYGNKIAKTTDPASLEDLLGRALFLINNNGNK